MSENSERLTLKVALGAIAKPQEIGTGGAKVVRFKAEDNKGNARLYETWSDSLVEFIKECAEKGEPVQADVAYSQKEGKDGTQYDHWKVIQCYRTDGSPVKQRSPGGGSKYYGKSPEERKSIEDQTRAYIIADLWKSSTIDASESLLVNKLKTWLSKLGEPLPIASKKEEPTTAKPATKAEKKEEPTPKVFANAGEFLKACLDNLDMNKSDVLEALSISDVSELENLNEAYLKLTEMKHKPPF